MPSEWCLIIATVGRVQEVARLLKSIPAHPWVHVVVVDQNSDGRLDDVVSSFDQLRITHVHIKPEGVADARNRGLDHVGNAAFVAFPDDDCIYFPDTLDTATAKFASNPDYDALICGWSEIGTPLGAEQQCTFRPVTKLGALNDTPTYNLFFRAKAIQRAGSFDTNLGLGAKTPWQSGEDTDFLLRAAAIHGRAARTESVWVQHPANPIRWPAGRAFAYGRGRTQLLRKHQFPVRVTVGMALHPLLLMMRPSETSRQVRWDSFRGRTREFLLPYRPSKTLSEPR